MAFSVSRRAAAAISCEEANKLVFTKLLHCNPHQNYHHQPPFLFSKTQKHVHCHCPGTIAAREEKKDDIMLEKNEKEDVSEIFVATHEEFMAGGSGALKRVKAGWKVLRH